MPFGVQKLEPGGELPMLGGPITEAELAELQAEINTLLQKPEVIAKLQQLQKQKTITVTSHDFDVHPYTIQAMSTMSRADREDLMRAFKQHIIETRRQKSFATEKMVGGTLVRRVDMPSGTVEFPGNVNRFMILLAAWEEHSFQATVQVKQLKRFFVVTRIARATGWSVVATELFNFVRKFDVLDKNIGKVTRDLSLRRQVLNQVKQSFYRSLQNDDFGPQGLQGSATVDATSFNRALREYMKYTRKDLAKVVNQKSYWIARNAVYMTKRMTAAVIRSELDAPSRLNPQLTVAEAIIINSERKKGNRLTEGQLKSAVKLLRSRRARSAGYLRSGWLQSVKAMSPHAEKKTPTFIENAARAELGGALAAVPNTAMKYRSSVWTNVKSENSKTNAVLQEGIRLAMNKEAASMMEYVNRKLQQGADKFNRGAF